LPGTHSYGSGAAAMDLICLRIQPANEIAPKAMYWRHAIQHMNGPSPEAWLRRDFMQGWNK
jgi:hypothetical protein